LVGSGEYAKYNTREYESPYEMVWAFVISILEEKGMEYITFVNEFHREYKNPPFITAEEHKIRKDRNDSIRYRQVDVNGLEGYSMCSHYSAYNWIGDVLKKRIQELGLPLEAFDFEYMAGDIVLENNATKLSIEDEEYKDKRKQNPIDRKYNFREFLSTFNSKTFQSNSCKSMQLIGTNGCEKYSTGKYDTARNMVFTFAMQRIDAMEMEYVNLVNSCETGKNPIFITEEDHLARKSRKENTRYKIVTSTAINGYCIFVNYSEYDWLKISLVKQLNALKLSTNDFYLQLEV